MNIPSHDNARYRIGAVSRLTGVAPDTLRVWERRYAAVVPQRSAGGGRLYSKADVNRLKLMKALVDAGDSIGTVARLDLPALQQRANEALAVPVSADAERRIRIVVVGGPLGVMLSSANALSERIRLVAVYETLAALETGGDAVGADILVIEQPTLHQQSALQIADLLGRGHIHRAIIVYRFASNEALQHLPATRCLALRAPLGPTEIESACLVLAGSRTAPSIPQVDFGYAGDETAPPRHYDDATLARLSAMSQTVKCECPRHLAELVRMLSAFERYSAECESRNAGDAKLHAYLNVTTAKARLAIEVALGHVVEAEGIAL